MSVRFRRAIESDAQVIAEFNCCLARETEQKELRRDTVTSGVIRGLGHGDDVQYWVAELEDDSSGERKIVGQLMLTREWSDWRDGWIVWLQSVYVVPAQRRTGVFRSLFGFVAEQLQQQADFAGLRLYVEHENERAMATYRSLGFTPAGYLVMECLKGASET